MRQVVLNLQMPPCAFTSDFGDFSVAHALSDEQRTIFQRWLQNGLPEGKKAPAPPSVSRGFRLGRPDIVLRLPIPPRVPTEGNPVWRAVLIDPDHDKPLRIRAFDIVPKSPKSVRHVLLAVASERAWMNRWQTNGTLDDDAARMIGAWAPGYRAFNLPEGVSLTLQPGERLVAQVLYQTTGTRVDTDLEIGLYLSQNADDREARWITREETDFQIVPFSTLKLTTTAELDRDVDLLAIVPEARFFASVVEALAIPIQGDPQTLLLTERWDPYWNGSFVFPSPVRAEKGTRLVSNTVYENEFHSSINEGRRPRLVYSGPDLDQEVCRTHFLVVDVPGR